MAYKALYRTYRPANFEEIAGQEHITRTFKNALKNNKIAHAYLFSGPRGTGKTSIAKIIAKAVNCEQSPIENPCNECEICRGIDNNTISDVIEIDAASNNGVDEIREIRDKVKYLPGVCKYKVYIIDEVHMLSTGAFNALLKTLEEPPKHVIFILATTEPHKIPATIHSRCQRFDFRGVSVPEMIKRLNVIVKEENISVSDEALKVISESAEGGMRDAISLLDQVVSYTDKEASVDDVHDIKGTVSNEKLLVIANAIYNNDSISAIDQMDDLISLGKESPRLIENLIKFYRDVLIFKNIDTNDSDQLIYSKQSFVDLAGKLSNNLLFFYIEVLNKAQQDMKWTNNAKLFMELALIKMVDKVEKQEIIIEDNFTKINDEIEYLRNKVVELENRKPEIIEVKKEEPIQSYSPVVEEETLIEPETTEHEEPLLIEEAQEETEELIEEPALLEVEPETKTESLNSFHELELSLDEEDEIEETVEQEEDKESEVIDEPEMLDEPEILEETEEKTESLFDYEVEEKEEKEEIIPEEKPISPYKTFDIRFVEDVLNNANREIKITMNSKWYDIERAVSHSHLSYAKMITEGRIVAAKEEMVIIEYPSSPICNRMMKPEIKQIITGILSDFYKREIDYLALPKEVWEEKSQEFIKIWKTQDKNNKAFIKLSDIINPNLKEIPRIDQGDKDMTPDSVKEAMNIFGKESVKVKKGDKLR